MMWLVLICASFFELAFTVCMKLSNGLKNVKFTVLTVISSCASIGLLSVATKLFHSGYPTLCGQDWERCSMFCLA